MASLAPADSMSDPNKSQILSFLILDSSLSIIPHNITLADSKRKEDTKWTCGDKKIGHCPQRSKARWSASRFWLQCMDSFLESQT